MSDTLIVVATYGTAHADKLASLRSPGYDLMVVDTTRGGHPTGAFKTAFQTIPSYDSYLFLQDSIRGNVEDVVAPFADLEAPVVAWGLFNLFFDSTQQMTWVTNQYPGVRPSHGIF